MPFYIFFFDQTMILLMSKQLWGDSSGRSMDSNGPARFCRLAGNLFSYETVLEAVRARTEARRTALRHFSGRALLWLNRLPWYWCL